MIWVSLVVQRLRICLPVQWSGLEPHPGGFEVPGAARTAAAWGLGLALCSGGGPRTERPAPSAEARRSQESAGKGMEETPAGQLSIPENKS